MEKREAGPKGMNLRSSLLRICNWIASMEWLSNDRTYLLQSSDDSYYGSVLLDSDGLIQIKDEVKMLHYDDIALEALRAKVHITCRQQLPAREQKKPNTATASAAAKLMCIDGTRRRRRNYATELFFFFASLHHLKYFLSSKTKVQPNSRAFKMVFRLLMNWRKDCIVCGASTNIV